jgi:FlaA1/EpsC-like NDP-sugar epimerase
VLWILGGVIVARVSIIKRFPNHLLSFFARLHDLVAVCLAWVIAYALRFNFDIPAEHAAIMWQSLFPVLLIQLLSFSVFGLYRGIWRFASLPDLKRILNAVISAALLIATIAFMLRGYLVVPRSVLVISPCLSILFLGGSRFFYRYLKDHQLYRISSTQGEPVIILGAGEAAISLVKELGLSERWQVVGLLDDDTSLHGREILGVRVYGLVSQLERFAKQLAVAHVIVAMPSVRHEARRVAIESANALGLSVLTVPAIDDLMSGRLNVSQLRPVDVEDLLGRDAVDLDQTGLSQLILDQVVLVTGAGGSIGSELCRQILKYQPKALVCYDLSEFALYQLEQELGHTAVSFVPIVGDIKNAQRISQLLAKYAPRAVFHAAAYKHVPLMETDNVSEALLNNVLGTHTLARACQMAGVDKFVLVSTDKAVNPTNVMGASKRLAEMVIQGLQGSTGTRFVMVRFGNVLGSSGSVVPKFREQIAAGGPITITHPEITRYFMSIPEAAQLVMQAGLMGSGGEIFVLDMGEPVRIVDLARDMIKLSGFKAGEISIEFVGLRPGEKLYEELLADDETTQPTPHHKLRIASARPVDEAWVSDLMEWVAITPQLDEVAIKQQLKTWVPEYVPDLKH